MLWCKHCNQPIEHPDIMRDNNGVGDYWDVEICPYCGGELDEADTCEWCGDWKDADEPLCPGCKEEFTESFWGWMESWIPAAGTTTEIIDMIIELFGGGR